MKPTAPGITLIRRIDASPTTIYQAWTDPVRMARWWAPRSVELISVEADARVGGTYSVRMRGADGAEYEVSGVYRVLQPPERLVFSWSLAPGSGRASQVTIILRPDGDGTQLTLIHEGEADSATQDDRRQGWTKSLNRLQHDLGDAPGHAPDRNTGD